MSVFNQVLPGIQHQDLLPRLRPYQQQAITWMLGKERNAKVNDKSDGMMEYIGTAVYCNIVIYQVTCFQLLVLEMINFT